MATPRGSGRMLGPAIGGVLYEVSVWCTQVCSWTRAQAGAGVGSDELVGLNVGRHGGALRLPHLPALHTSPHLVLNVPNRRDPRRHRTCCLTSLFRLGSIRYPRRETGNP